MGTLRVGYMPRLERYDSAQLPAVFESAQLSVDNSWSRSATGKGIDKKG